MKDYIFHYWSSLYNEIPMYIYMGVLVVLVFSVFILVMWDRKTCLPKILGVMTVEYVFLLYCSTVFLRSIEKERLFNLMPFWSYGAYCRGEDFRLLPENIMNVLAFIPIGLLLGGWYRNISWLKVLFIGCSVSVSIELLQLVLKKGLCEFDDVIHNTLGCLIGYGIYVYFSKKKLLTLK